MFPRHIASIAAFVIASFVAAAAQQIAPSDPAASAMANRALVSLSGGVGIADATLMGTVTRFAGSSRDVGTVEFQALGTRFSRATFDFGIEKQVEVRADSDSAPAGAWAGSDGMLHSISTHNCWTEPVWFFPILGVLNAGSTPGLQVSYAGREIKNDIKTEHLHFSHGGDSQIVAANALISSLSGVDLYLDAVSFLPLAVSFAAHPDGDASVTLPIEIRFADYRSINGVLVPFRIQRLLNGSLTLDVSLQSVTLNSGISPTIFNLQ